jgi:hypothetical protein
MFVPWYTPFPQTIMRFLSLLTFPLLATATSFSWLWKPKKILEPCDLYLAPSLLPGGHRGIFAGRTFSKSEIIEIDPTLVIPTDLIRDLQFFNYAFSANDFDHSMSVFGVGMLFNHAPASPATSPAVIPATYHHQNIDYQWNSVPISNPKLIHNIYSQPHTQYTDLTYLTITDVQIGQELYANYGRDDWFVNRKIEPSQISSSSSPQHHTLEHLQQTGHCLTHLSLNISTIPLAGRGVFTKRSYQIGERITISPVLIFPKHRLELETLDSSVLYNYCLISPGSDVAMLPIGLGAMMNHGGEKLSNVRIDWYDWDITSKKRREQMTPQELERSPFAPLDIQYIATRDISRGEELFLSYGLDWEIAWWKYFKQLQKWNERKVIGNLTRTSLSLKPQFRQAITVPQHLFPSSFYSNQCVGVDCEISSKKKMSSKGNPLTLSLIENAEKYFFSIISKSEE